MAAGAASRVVKPAAVWLGGANGVRVISFFALG